MINSGVYNALVKTFPDGKKQYHFFPDGRFVGSSKDEITFDSCGKYLISENVWVDSETGEVVAEFVPESSVERKEIDNLKRARSDVFDIARSNSWDWFVTLTFDPKVVDRYDYAACSDLLASFLKYLRRHGCRYILVPDRHEDGAYHFHGLIAGDLPVVFSGVRHHRRKVFNLSGYSLGWTTATKVRDNNRCATYITGYLADTDQRKMEIPKGRHRFWASRGLCRPTVERGWLSKSEMEDIIAAARYKKICPSDYGDMILTEE